MRDYRGHLQTVLKRRPATVNNALAAVDDLYIRRGLGPASAKRAEIPAAAPRALSKRAQIRYLRAVQACSSPRDRALALVPFYAGARIAETVAYRRDPARLLSRVQLSASVPELRARFLVEQNNGVELLAPLLARKRAARGDDLRLRVIGSSLLAAVSVALDLWQKDDGHSDLLALLDRATDALAEGMSELRSSAGERNAPAKRRASAR